MKILSDYKNLLNESVHANAVEKIVKYLNSYYLPVDGVFPIADEFVTKRMVEKKIDGGKITPRQLNAYIKSKFNGYSGVFIDEIIKEWFQGSIRSDFILHKNVSMYES